MITVLNTKKHNIPVGAVYVGRPSPLGNPYKIGPDGDRDDVIAQYYIYFYLMIELNDFYWHVMKAATATALVCWCAPEACHADVIAEYLANSEKKSEAIA